jgi:hypothetical protein
MNNLELFQILRPIVQTVTGVQTVILADQNQAAPKGEYVTIRPRQSINERGQANIRTKNVPGDKVSTDVRAQIIATCSLNFYRGEAMANAQKLKQCNKRPDVSMSLFKSKIGWGGTDAVNNLTSLQSSNWEQRAQVMIRLLYETSDVVEINNILSTQVILQNEKGTTLQIIDVP